MSVLLEALPTRAPEASTRTDRAPTVGIALLAVLPLAAMLVADPVGLAPFGPAKWLAVSTLAACGAGLVLVHRTGRPVIVSGRRSRCRREAPPWPSARWAARTVLARSTSSRSAKAL